jgi:CHAD domain-containing protein
MLRVRHSLDGDATGGSEGHGLALPRVGPDDPAAAAVQAALAEGLHRLRVHDPAAREGDPEGVHRLRTTTRRLRSALGLFAGLTDRAWADRVADDLKWLAGKLGDVRDLDVLTDRLAAAARDAGTVEALDPLFAQLRERHQAASAALAEALRGDRYAGLTGRLADALAAIPLADAAWEPCRSALPPLVGGVWGRLKKAGRALTPDDPDEQYHEVRKRAKRARYAAETVADALDPEASDAAGRFARRARKVQDVLGEHQDAVVAAAEIRKAADAHPTLGPFNFAAGRLLETQLRAADTSRAGFPAVWDRLDRKKVVRWLKV